MQISENTVAKLKEYTKVVDIKFVYNSKARETDEGVTLYGLLVDQNQQITLGMFKVDVSETNLIMDAKLELSLIIAIMEKGNCKEEFTNSITATTLVDKLTGDYDLEQLWDQYNGQLMNQGNILHIVQTWAISDAPEFASVYIWYNTEKNGLEADFRDSRKGSGVSQLFRR